MTTKRKSVNLTKKDFEYLENLYDERYGGYPIDKNMCGRDEVYYYNKFVKLGLAVKGKSEYYKGNCFYISDRGIKILGYR